MACLNAHRTTNSRYFWCLQFKSRTEASPTVLRTVFLTGSPTFFLEYVDLGLESDPGLARILIGNNVLKFLQGQIRIRLQYCLSECENSCFAISIILVLPYRTLIPEMWVGIQ